MRTLEPHDGQQFTRHWPSVGMHRYSGYSAKAYHVKPSRISFQAEQHDGVVKGGPFLLAILINVLHGFCSFEHNFGHLIKFIWANGLLVGNSECFG